MGGTKLGEGKARLLWVGSIAPKGGGKAHIHQGLSSFDFGMTVFPGNASLKSSKKLSMAQFHCFILKVTTCNLTHSIRIKMERLYIIFVRLFVKTTFDHFYPFHLPLKVYTFEGG